MLFSVIVPVYNSERFLRSCLDSICNQTFTNFEVVIIDDGSTDSSFSIVDDYSKKDSRIKVYHFSNSGVSISRRRGISLANGDYLIFVDSDDTINPNLLYEVYLAIQKFESPDIIRFQSNLLGDKPYKDHLRYNFDLHLNNRLSGMEALKIWSVPGKKYAVYWLFAFRRTTFANIFFLPNIRCYEDVAFIPVLIASSKSVVTIGYCGYNYTCNNSSSLTNQRSRETEKSRAIDFFYAYRYAIDSFMKLDNISGLDVAFFIEDYNRRLKGKFNSLSKDLQKELAPLFGM